MEAFSDKSKTSAYAELDIWGEAIDPEVVSSILGIIPHITKKVGELGVYTHRPNKVASWVYRTTEKETEDISKQLDELSSVFKGKIEELKKIRQLFNNCLINVCIVLYNHQKILPGLSISAEGIAFLADLGVGLEFDIYHNEG